MSEVSYYTVPFFHQEGSCKLIFDKPFASTINLKSIKCLASFDTYDNVMDAKRNIIRAMVRIDGQEWMEDQ